MNFRDRLWDGRIPWWPLALVLAALLGADLLVHHHEYLGMEDTFGFHVWLALAAGAGAVGLVVLVVKRLRREEAFYDD